MTREEFETVKAAGVRKWTEGAEQTEGTYREWWNTEGMKKCNFCRSFTSISGCSYSSRGETFCPIEDYKGLVTDNICAKEFNNIRKASVSRRKESFAFTLFHANAVALRDRIAALKYEDLKQ